LEVLCRWRRCRHGAGPDVLRVGRVHLDWNCAMFHQT
jgi:hypothetical protein